MAKQLGFDFSTGSAGSAADTSTGSAGSAADTSTGSAGSAADNFTEALRSRRTEPAPRAPAPISERRAPAPRGERLERTASDERSVREREAALALERARSDAAARRVDELARLSGRLVEAAKRDDVPGRRGQPPTDPPPLRLAKRLALGLGAPVRLTVTDNRRTMLSARRGEGVIEVRLHRMFLEADDALVETLVRYLAQRERAAGDAIEAFIAENRALITKPRERRTILRTRGAHHDLRTIFDALLPRFTESFDGVHITWGRLTRRKRGQRGLQLGTYTPAERLVRIHPVLDQAWVPHFVVATVVHHEMLHHALPAVEANGKTFFHTPEFRRREAEYPDHRRTEAWERAHLPALLRSMPR